MTSDPHEEVVGLDVAVDEVLVVDVPEEEDNVHNLFGGSDVDASNLLDSPNHLIGQHEDSLHGESSGAEVEEIFEAGTEEVHDEDVVVALLAVPPDVRDADSALQDFVQLALVQELGVAGLHTLQLNSHLKLCIMSIKVFLRAAMQASTHLLPIGDVDTQVDVSEAPGSNLPDEAIFSSHDELGARGGGCARHLRVPGKRLKLKLKLYTCIVLVYLRCKIVFIAYQ